MKRLPLHSILVVDDEESYRRILKTYLEEIGFVCHTAKNASEAGHIIQEETSRRGTEDQQPGSQKKKSSGESLWRRNSRHIHQSLPWLGFTA